MRAVQVKKFGSHNGFVRIEGDINHTFRTAQFIKGNLRPRFRKHPEDIEDEKVQDWYAHGDIDQITPNIGETIAHVRRTTPVNHTATLKPFTLNRSIKSLLIEPQATMNHQECRPRDQATILPYLCDAVVRKIINVSERTMTIPDADFQEVHSVTGAPSVFDVQAFEYVYRPDEQNVMFVSRTAATNCPCRSERCRRVCDFGGPSRHCPRRVMSVEFHH